MPRPLARIAGALLGAALAGMVVPADRAVAQTARTTPVVNRAAVAYVDGDGLSGGDAATVTVTVTHQAGVTLASPLAVSAGAGTQVVLAHTLTNTGTDADPIVLQATGPAGWPFLIYRDSDGSGTLTAADTPVAAPLALAAGQSAALLVVTTVPAGTPAGAVSIMLRATSGVDAAAVATLTDQVTVTATPTGTPGATVTKVVDRAHAAAGDTLHYTISFAGTGDAPTPAATLADPLPAGLAYVPGSLRLGAAALTDAADADAGTVTTDDAGRATVQVTLGPIAPGATGTVTFAAVLQRGAAGALTNVAALSWGDTTIASTPAATGVAMPELTLAKSVVGRDSVRVGGEVRFELRYGNASTSATATGVALVDTLPAELAFVSAEGSPTVAGQVVTWTLGDVAPGASGTFALVTRAVAAPAAGGGVVNHAMLEGSNASSAAATAQPLTVRAFRGDELSLAKTAGLLQAGLGDAVPYALTLRNTGTTALAGIVVRDRLPEGLRYLPDATVGADSTRVGGPNGTELTFFVAAPLAPGATQVVRYAAMVASAGRGNSFTNVAIAEAEDGTVRSDSARAEVQRRRGFAMQGKTLIGKVWLDRDGDGRQHGDEPGIAGVRIISADGQIVTTDKEGRYSFRDLPPSTQALRLDPRGVPAGLMLAKPGDEVVVVRADGWTTPRVDFRLVLRPLPQVASTTVPDVGALPPVLDAALMPPTDSAAHAAPATETVAAPAAPADSTAPRWISAATLLGTTASAAPAVAPARPAVRITSPGEGSVIGTNKVYVGVQGEPGSEVTLYDGGEKIAQATLRPDGRADFVAVELTEGDHVLRTTMRTPDGREEWNDVFVHRSGAPNWLELAG
ncbi:MAG TPA: SdrD B-like domain-containing protein, partial [Gemmatimonadales bacterium]|nr:SdrD B-like domain-containing protein [Gemmatimonadales bacterium]